MVPPDRLPLPVKGGEVAVAGVERHGLLYPDVQGVHK